MRAMLSFFKVLTTLVVIFMVSSVSAQTLEEARNLYNEGGEAVQAGDISLAVEKFTACSDMCETLYEEEEDEEAEELMNTVQQNIPKLIYQLSKEKLQAKAIMEGLELAYQAKDASENYGDNETLEKTKKIIPQVHYKIGVSKYKKEDLDGALVEFGKALAVNPNYADVYYIECVVYKKQANDEKFYETAKKGIVAAKESNKFKIEDKIVKMGSSHYLKKGNQAKESSNYDEAIALLNKSLEFDGENTTVFYLLTSIHNSKKDWVSAISSANEGLKYEDAANKARFHFELGNAYFGKGDSTAACEAYSLAAVGDYAEHANYQMEHVVKCE